jgi:hypothetical protein
MKALIDPRFNRVCELALDQFVFPVAEPLFWVDCQENCIPDFDYWDETTQMIIYPERPLPPEEGGDGLIGTTVESF